MAEGEPRRSQTFVSAFARGLSLIEAFGPETRRMSVAEAAQRTGASESAIKVQVHRGLKRLAAKVKEEST